MTDRQEKAIKYKKVANDKVEENVYLITTKVFLLCKDLEDFLKESFCILSGKDYEKSDISAIIDIENLIYHFKQNSVYKDLLHEKMKGNENMNNLDKLENNLNNQLARLSTLYELSEKIGILLEYEHQKSKEQKK